MKVLHKVKRRLQRALHMNYYQLLTDSALDAHFLVNRSTKSMLIHRLVDKQNACTQIHLYFKFQKGNMMNFGNKYPVSEYLYSKKQL